MNPKRQALVIGINEYNYPEQLPDLTSAVSDAEKIAQLLETQGDFTVTRLPCLIDQQQKSQVHPNPPSSTWVDLKTLQQNIEQFFYPEGEQVPDVALLFFAGHGLNKPRFGKFHSYLAAVNSNPEDEIWGYALTDLQDLLKASPIKNKIVWLDACHSGALIRDFNFEDGSQYCLVAASADYDVAYESAETKQGYLTKILLKALNVKPGKHHTVTSHDLVKTLERIRRYNKIQQNFTYKNSHHAILITGQHLIKTEKVLEKVCPYKGLHYFDFEGYDPQLYFGRNEETNQLLNLVLKNRFVAVLGASGSGKSSLVRAGLIYQLQTGIYTSGEWQILPIIRPSTDPLSNLKSVLKQQNSAKKCLLIIDQFEEIFTLTHQREQQHAFFEKLLSLETIYRVIVIRSDFFPHTLAHHQLAKAIEKNQFLVSSMTTEQLTTVIEKPAEKVGFHIEPALTVELIQELKQTSNHLPLLQYTLEQIYQQSQNGSRQLQLKTYQDLGGLKGALTQKAQALFDSFNPIQQVTLKWLLLELTQLGEGQEDTRKQVKLKDLKRHLNHHQDVDTVIEKLVAERLVIKDKNSQNETIVDLAHEALIREWPLLREWINQNREFKRWQDELRHRQTGALLTGVDLVAAEKYFYSHHEKITPQEQTYIKKSMAVKSRNDWLKRGTVITLFLLLILFGWQWLLANQARNDAIEQETIAKNSEQKTKEQEIEAKRSFITQKKVSLILGKQALKENKPISTMRIILDSLLNTSDENKLPYFSPQDIEKLQNEVTALENEVKPLLYAALERHQRGIWQHEAAVSYSEFSPDGKILLTTTASAQSIETLAASNYAYLWEFPSGKLLHVLKGHTRGILEAAFSPDGTKIMTSSTDGSVRLWDVKTGNLLHIFYDKQFSITINSRLVLTRIIRAKFSPDSQQIAITSFDRGDVYIYDTNTYEELFTLFGHKSNVLAISYSPDGEKIASASRDNTVRVWDSKTGKQRLLLNAEEKVLVQQYEEDEHLYESPVAFSYGADMPKITSNMISGKSWVTGDKANTHTIDPGFSDILFTPDGNKIIAGKVNGKILIWDTNTGQKLHKLVGHEQTHLIGSRISPNGQILATGAFDKTAHLWHIETGQLLTSLKGHKSEISSLLFSRDGKKIITTSLDKTVRLWSVETGKQLKLLDKHQQDVNYGTLSPDGHWLVTASNDKTTRIWNSTTYLPLGLVPTNEGGFIVSPDGNRMVTCDYVETEKNKSEPIVSLWTNQGQNLISMATTSCDYADLTQDGKTLVIQPKLEKNNEKDKTVFHLFDTAKGNKRTTIQLNNQISASYTSQNGQRLALRTDNDEIHIFNIDNGENISVIKLSKPCSAPTSIRFMANNECAFFSPDSHRLLVTSYSDAYLFDTSTGKLLTSFKNPDRIHITDVALSSNGSKVLLGYNSKLARLWDGKTGKIIHTLSNHADDVDVVAFGTDDKKILTASKAKAYLWDSLTGKKLFTLAGHQRIITKAFFDEDNQRVHTWAKFGNRFDERRVWDINTGKSLGMNTCPIVEQHKSELKLATEYIIDQELPEFDSMTFDYCPDDKSNQIGFTIKKNYKENFYFFPIYPDLEHLKQASLQYIGQYEWNCEERQKYTLDQTDCSTIKPPKTMDQKTAIYWQYATAGDAYMQYALAIAYSEGSGVEPNPQKSFEWMYKAAKQGHIAAQALLGSRYLNGDGTEKNAQEAAKWFLKAAEQGQADAQSMVCAIYLNGLGIKKDVSKALQWCKETLKNRFKNKKTETARANAHFGMGVMYQTGQGVKQNFLEAEKHYQEAYKLGRMDAVTQLKVTAINPDNIPDAQSVKLGLQVGDLFIEYDGKPVLNYGYFIAYRATESANDKPKELKVLRNGKYLTFQIHPGLIGVSLENLAK